MARAFLPRPYNFIVMLFASVFRIIYLLKNIPAKVRESSSKKDINPNGTAEFQGEREGKNPPHSHFVRSLFLYVCFFLFFYTTRFSHFSRHFAFFMLRQTYIKVERKKSACYFESSCVYSEPQITVNVVSLKRWSHTIGFLVSFVHELSKCARHCFYTHTQQMDPFELFPALPKECTFCASFQVTVT